MSMKVVWIIRFTVTRSQPSWIPMGDYVADQFVSALPHYTKKKTLNQGLSFGRVVFNPLQYFPSCWRFVEEQQPSQETRIWYWAILGTHSPICGSILGGFCSNPIDISIDPWVQTTLKVTVCLVLVKVSLLSVWSQKSINQPDNVISNIFLRRGSLRALFCFVFNRAQHVDGVCWRGNPFS